MFSFVKNLFTETTSPDSEKDCKYLVIPDLHGTYSIYKEVEAYIKNECEEDRTVIFLGDYFDRGESMTVYGREFHDGGSYHLLKDILKLKEWASKNERKILFLRGNHELFFEDYFLKDSQKPYDLYPFFRESVETFEFAFEHDYSLFSRFEYFLEGLLPYHLDQKNGYLFVHAGVDFTVGSLKEQAKKGTIYWIRHQFIQSESKLPYTVIFGHTPFDEVFHQNGRIGLDSGIYKSGFINLLRIDGADLQFLKFPESMGSLKN